LGEVTRGRLGRRALASIVGVACASAGLVHAAPPPDPVPEVQPPTEPQTAAEWYTHGYELGVAGNYEAAAAAFLRSYELQRTAEALFNAALAYEQAGKTIEAIETYERFMAEPSPPADLIEAAHQSIEALLPTIAVLKGLRYAPEQPPAELYVDGERVELDAFPRLVLPGEIEIEVVAKSGARASESYELAAGEKLIVDLRGLLPPPELPPPEIVEVEDDGPTVAELEAARVRARQAATLRKLTWVGLGVTGATAIGAATLGGLAQRESDLYEKYTCFQFTDDVCPSDFELGDAQSHLRAYHQYVRSGTILAGISGGFAIATLVIGIVAARKSKPRAGAPSVLVVPMSNGIVLRF
jgi:tetratricopeptide (TPR) repeat protein